MKNIVLFFSYDLTITEGFKSHISLLIYSIIWEGKDIKLQCQDCFCIWLFFMAETTDTIALEKRMCVNNP